MYDLNALAPNSPVYLQVGGDINDAGIIVGQGCLPANCSAGTSFVSFIAVPTGDGKYQVSATAAASRNSIYGARPAATAPHDLLQRLAFGKLARSTSPQN